MEKHGDEIDVTESEAKAGARPQGVRIVLAISLILAIIIMTFIWVIPALSN